MDILLKGFYTLWVVCLTIGTVAFYSPGEKAKKISFVLGIISFGAFPAIYVLTWMLYSIWS